MKSAVRYSISFLFLLSILFPLVGKEFHDFQHRHDFHCAEKYGKHFHELEHNCSLCDYVTPVSGTPEQNFSSFVCFTSPAQNVIVPETHAIATFHRSIPARGPPALI